MSGAGSFLEEFDRSVRDEPTAPTTKSAATYSLRPIEARFAPTEPFALHGAVITPGGVLASGYVVVDGQCIGAVQGTKPDVKDVRETGGVILPGLIDMHNHPNYNIFPAWEPPQLYDNRGVWRASREYDELIKQPQERLKKLRDLGCLPQNLQLRYAEIRALIAGVTAIQGANDERPDGGRECLVRNIDRLVLGQQRAHSYIDLAHQDDIDNFVKDQGDASIDTIYLHLSEGKHGDQACAQEFDQFLRLGGATGKTVIIHGSSLTPDQIQHVAEAGCKLVWSPQSNLRLYGETTLVAEALRNHMPVALGADWLPSGSTSLLAEMKVAERLFAAQGAKVPSDALVRMVTSDAAEIAGLGGRLGVLAEGSPADILVLERHCGDAYDNVVAADPSWVEMVIIGGDVCYSRADWRPDPPPAGTESVCAWGKQMVLDTQFGTAPGDANLSLGKVRALLTALYPPVGPIFA